jgi:hypothetical protein
MLVIKQFATMAEANHMIRGGLITGRKTTTPFENLVGKAITFATPAGNKTFTQPAGKPVGQLTFADVKAQLEAAIANLKVISIDDKLAFYHATAGSAVSLAAAAETGRVPLGFADNVAVAGQALAGPSGVAPKLVGIATENGSITIVTEV